MSARGWHNPGVGKLERVSTLKAFAKGARIVANAFSVEKTGHPFPQGCANPGLTFANAFGVYEAWRFCTSAFLYRRRTGWRDTREIKIMPDLLVNLLKLPTLESAPQEFLIRRPHPFELGLVRSFVAEKFSARWADEIAIGFARQPVSVFIASIERELVGFAAYECTRRGFFGPMGVADTVQGKGVGKALLLAALWGLREMGYVYAIVGAAGPVHFYQKTVGAIVIPESEPGIYTDLLKSKQ
jgi:predicted N-acetyltransferase YhbS